MAQFSVGDRCFSHYTMQWGTITKVDRYEPTRKRGDGLGIIPGSTWYYVLSDNGEREYLDDADGDWHMARIVPAHIAKRNGYGSDPHA